VSLPKLLVVCPAVLFPLDMASKVRILNILKAARERFEITFLSTCDRRDITSNERALQSICSQVVILPSRNRKNHTTRFLHRTVRSLLYYSVGLPSELYYSGILNLSPKRVQSVLGNTLFDVVLFEYWFGSTSVEYFRKIGIPCILDMHDILWKKRVTSKAPNENSMVLVRKYQNFLDRRYRLFEETMWNRFDGLISINTAEERYVRQKLSSNISIINAGMGVDVSEWPYCWRPEPDRVIFYGSLSSRQNIVAALRCAKRIMPIVWAKVPAAQLWIVGANPPRDILDLKIDPRIKVTGFIDRPQQLISTAQLVLCPLKGEYGFRSRLIEVMSLGVPVVCTTDAVYGMNLENGYGVLAYDDDGAIAEAATEVLTSPDFAKGHSLAARRQVEEKFSFDATYGCIISFLLSYLKT
jgi:glycosyltransferase involved in cell wall biosynthesis